MKKITFALLILVLSVGARAQKVNISIESSDARGLVIKNGQKITSFSCRTIDAGHAQELTELARSLRKDNFEEGFSVRKGKGQLQLLSRDGKNGQTEVACLLVGKEGNGVYLTVAGNCQHQ